MRRANTSNELVSPWGPNECSRICLLYLSTSSLLIVWPVPSHVFALSFASPLTCVPFLCVSSWVLTLVLGTLIELPWWCRSWDAFSRLTIFCCIAFSCASNSWACDLSELRDSVLWTTRTELIAKILDQTWQLDLKTHRLSALITQYRCDQNSTALICPFFKESGVVDVLYCTKTQLLSERVGKTPLIQVMCCCWHQVTCNIR